MSFWEFANPARFMRLTDWLMPLSALLAGLALLTGLVWGFFGTPDERFQKSAVKIIFIHVPSAMMAINIYAMMFVTSLIWLIRRHHVSALAAKAAAPIGLTMTVIALLTGMLWGQPIWNTPWQWEPRLTFFFILFLFYLGYIALWAAIEDPDTAADLTSVLALVGSVFALLSRYGVNFWRADQQLHQGSTLSLDSESNIDNVFWLPLLICIAGFILLFVSLLFQRTRTEIRARRLRALMLAGNR